MADNSFFAGLHSNIRMPETIMNSGPLPPESTAGYPYTLDGLPNARINYGSSLLGDVDPYTYGEPDQLSNQTSYLNIPNRIQKIVPLLKLPECTKMATSSTFMLTHAVDDGDVAFVIREGTHNSKMLLNQRELDKFYNASNYHALVNLPTVNYLLVGIQLYYSMKVHSGLDDDRMPLPNEWEMFLDAVVGDWQDKPMDELIIDIIQNYITPFGVVHGSEKQGGQHEGTLSPVTWACNFISTFYVDGYVRNMCNVWRNSDIRSGSHLMFELVPCPFLENNKFQLNHYSKATVTRDFHASYADHLRDRSLDDKKIVLILRPTVLHGHGIDKVGWRIALSYVQRRKIGSKYNTATDDKAMLNGPLLEAAFGPKFLMPVSFTAEHPEHPDNSSEIFPEQYEPQENEQGQQGHGIMVTNRGAAPVAQPMAAAPRAHIVAPAPQRSQHSALLASTSKTMSSSGSTNSTGGNAAPAAAALASGSKQQTTSSTRNAEEESAAAANLATSAPFSTADKSQSRKSRSSSSAAVGGGSVRKRRDRSEDVQGANVGSASSVAETLSQADDLLAQLDTI